MIFTTYLLYKLYADKCYREDFEGTTQNTTSGIDDTNAINTLAQIAKNLMAGGVTVPGSMGLLGNMTFNNAGANFITINKGTKSDPQTIHLWNSDSQLILVGKNDANNDYSWPGIVLDTKKSNIKTNSLNTNSINVAGAINAQSVTTPKGSGYRVTTESGQSYGIWGGGGSGFASNNGLEIHTYKPDGGWQGNPLNIIGNDSNFGGNVNIGGGLNVQGRNILAELNNLNAKTANLNLGNYTIGPEGPYLVIRTQGHEGRWAYRTGTNWG
jgi:hypothetical protein